MSFDLEAFKKALEEDLANPNGYWNTIKKETELLGSRFPKIEKYLDSCDFPELMNRLAQEHGKEYQDKCWKEGYETYPNNKFSLLWRYLENNLEHVHNIKIPQDFLGSSFFFKGYWFCVYHGQGSFYRVYDNDMNQIFQI